MYRWPPGQQSLHPLPARASPFMRFVSIFFSYVRRVGAYDWRMEFNPVAVRIEFLTKYYGKQIGIKDLNLDIHHGEVLGFLGPNGAGKSTTIRTLLGLIKPTSGRVTFLGEDALRQDPILRNKTGYLPGTPIYYNSYKAIDFLIMVAEIRNVNCRDTIHDYASRLKLDLQRKVGELSKGNRQKVGVIQAFMHLPDILFLDEPTSGLDPLVQIEFEKILDEAKARGAAILLSSHVMSEVEHLADRIAIINEGNLIVLEDIVTLRAKTHRKIDLHFSSSISESEFGNLENIFSVEKHGQRITCTFTGSEREILQKALTLNVQHVHTRETSLEDIFLSEIGKQ